MTLRRGAESVRTSIVTAGASGSGLYQDLGGHSLVLRGDVRIFCLPYQQLDIGPASHNPGENHSGFMTKSGGKET